MPVSEEPPQLTVTDAAAWRRWLVEHHSEQAGVWLLLAKKGTLEPTSLRYQEALEEALCFGWIDGQSRGVDVATVRQRFTPRRVRSMWSQRNIGIVTRLIDEGRMQPAGLAEIERAQSDGRWEAAYRVADTVMPDDFAAAIAEVPTAAAMVEILTKQNMFAMVFRLSQLKREETRIRRIDEYVQMLSRGETIYPQRRTLPRPSNPPGGVAGS